MSPVLRLKRGHERARVHPWIFKADVADVSDAVVPGAAVTIVDAAGRFVGRGFYNPRPALCCRVLTRLDEPLDAGFLRRRLDAALALRAAGAPSAAAGDTPPPGRHDFPGSTAGRLVWSEGDLLPGLIVDRYADVLVIQCQTLGMARARSEIAALLRERLGERPLFGMDDAVGARLEGFEPARGWLDRPGPASVILREGEATFRVTIGAGHKTGLYLDQADNRIRVQSLARGRDVLDVFCYAAGFTCHALLGGARRAIGIESSPEAIAAARENLALNRVAERAEIRPTNAFDELRRLERAGERFGLVVLDPPPFARSRARLEAAARGYKEINLRGMRLLEPGGFLATFACSHHVSDALFEEICREAAADAGVVLRVTELLTQAPDHPVLLTVPETRYLTGRLLQAV
jgi:23S rRNA (cytosine1962-C5)-methyltransferase